MGKRNPDPGPQRTAARRLPRPASTSPRRRAGPAEAELERAARHLCQSDRQLAPLIERVGACRLDMEGDPYRALVRSVLRQQLAGAAARAIDARLRGRFGGRIPPASALAELDEAALRAIGVSRQKAATLRALAQAFACGSLRAAALRRMSDGDVVQAVTQIRGIGEWTAHMLLIFSLGRLDVLPFGDYGVRKAASLVYALEALPGRGELEALAERWRPFRSVASWYLWRQLDARVTG